MILSIGQPGKPTASHIYYCDGVRVIQSQSLVIYVKKKCCANLHFNLERSDRSRSVSPAFLLRFT